MTRLPDGDDHVDGLHPSDVLAYLGGFVAAEGTFAATPVAAGHTFRFAVHLGARDLATCELFHRVLGCGTVRSYPRRRPHYDDEVVFQVRRQADLRSRVVPFLDAHLPPSHKRAQFEGWRAVLLAHPRSRARPPRRGQDASAVRQSTRGTSLQSRSRS